MTSRCNQIKLNSIVILLLTTLASLAACTEKTVDGHQPKTIASTTTITEEKIAKLQGEAQKGDPDAQYSLAYLYENGLGVTKNEAKALELYQQAADQGHSAAQNNLNAMSLSK